MGLMSKSMNVLDFSNHGLLWVEVSEDGCRVIYTIKGMSLLCLWCFCGIELF